MINKNLATYSIVKIFTKFPKFDSYCKFPGNDQNSQKFWNTIQRHPSVESH